MRAPSFIKSLSFRLPAARRSTSPIVAPLPRETPFYQQVEAELDIVRSSKFDVRSANWLSSVLDASIATQKLAQEHSLISINRNSNLSPIDKEMIDDYLEDNIELLDACNGLVEKMGVIQEYVDTLKVATRSSRAQEALTKCVQLEKECAKLDKCNSKLSRLMGQKTNTTQVDISHELHEILSMSREMAIVSCHRIQRALSFKSKQGFMKMKSFRSTTFNDLLVSKEEDGKRPNQKCVSPWMMNELEEMIMVSKVLHDQQEKLCNDSFDIDLLRKRCEALEEGLKNLEEKVRELYRHLISFRMALMGILSHS